MGTDISCPCSRNVFDEEVSKENQDVISKIMNGKLNQNEILLEFNDDQMKVCLIKTENIEKFFNNRNLLRITTKKDHMKYYNTVFISNYLAKNDLTLIVLQDSPFRYKLSNKKNRQESNTNTLTQSISSGYINSKENGGKYSVESVNLVSSNPDQVIQQISHNFISNLRKGYQFIGLINDSPKYVRQFHILYKLGYSKEENYNYSIQIFKGELDEKIIEKMVNEPENKKRRLKAIMIDFIQLPNEEKDVSKSYNDKKKSNKNKYYYFIFEESSDFVEQMYLIVKMDRNNSPAEVYLQDISVKLSDTVNNVKLVCIVSDENSFFFIFNSQTLGDDMDDLDDFDMVDIYLKSDQ